LIAAALGGGLRTCRPDASVLIISQREIKLPFLHNFENIVKRTGETSSMNGHFGAAALSGSGGARYQPAHVTAGFEIGADNQ